MKEIIIGIIVIVLVMLLIGKLQEMTQGYFLGIVFIAIVAYYIGKEQKK